VHHGDSLLGVASLGRFSRQHDTVGSIENSIANVADFSTGRSGVVGHGFQHLGGADGRLASHVALGDHHLLGDEDLSWRNFNTQVTTGNHDTVCYLEDLIEVVYSLLVLDLGDDLDVLAILTQTFADGSNVAGLTNERGKDHVDLVFDAESQIVLVLLGERGQINIGLRQVDTFS